MNSEWMRISKPKVGQEVLLCQYRKVRGKKLAGDGMDELRMMLVGKEGNIFQVNNGQIDSSGCPLAWVEVEGKQLSWRVASLKKKRHKSYRPMK